MFKACFLDNCTEEVIFVCNCSGKSTYCCKTHQATHCLESTDHHIKPLLIVIPQAQYPELINHINTILESVKKIQLDLVTISDNLISKIIGLTKSSLNHIRETEKFLILFYAKLLSRKMVNTEEYDLLKTLNLTNTVPNIENILHITQEISKLFQINFLSNTQLESEATEFESDMIIAPIDRTTGGLFSIDLNTFSFDLIDYAPCIGGGVQAARIDQDLYFFYGGMKPGYNGEVFILNTNQKNYQTYPPSSILGYGGTVYKQGKVYIFGGTDDSTTAVPLDTCKAFDIATSTWNTVQSLPAPLLFGTAAVINKKIMVTGYSFESVYVYENNAYTQVLNTEGCGFKILCAGWVITGRGLYENKGGNNDVWEVYVSHWGEEVLWMPVSFKKGKFIYFVNGNSNDLWRIDTQEKIIEKVSYY